MNDKDFHYVLTISKCNSISKAAELLYVSQPALSRYINSLEEKLGVTLFDRSSSPICLTSAGKRFCIYANTILDLENKLLLELKQASSISGHTIKVGVPYVTGEYILSRIIPRVIHAYPNIQIDPIQDLAGNLVKRLTAHQIDAAFVCSPISDAAIRSELLFYEKIYLVGHRNHPALIAHDTANATLEHPLILDFEKLRNVSLIHCKPIAIMSYVAEEALKKAHFQPEKEIKASSLPHALDLTTQCNGFTSVLHCQLKYSHPGITQTLCPIHINDCKLPFYLSYNSHISNTTPEMELFIKEVLKEYQAAPYI